MKLEPGELTAEKARTALSYDPVTGLFTWTKNRGGSSKTGALAGSVNKDGYIVIQLFNKGYLAHRLAWLMFYNEWPAIQIDHVNRVRNDNRIDNLRVADDSLNALNAAVSSTNRSGFKGVCWNKSHGKWYARAVYKGTVYSLGGHKTALDAHKAYVAFRNKCGTAHLGELAAS